MTDSEFNQLLDRYTEGTATSEEQQQLERWMDNIKEGVGPFKSEMERLRMKTMLQSAIYAKAGIEEGKSRTLVPTFLKIAASIALLIVTVYGIWTIAFDKVETNSLAEVTGTTGIQKVILSDSTIVWLKPGSKLSYPQKFEGNERKVTLIGEALFEVAKDSSRPFFVACDDITARVVGTSFNIKSTAASIDVLVLTGKVIVSSKASSENLTVLPNEKVSFNRAAGQLAKVEPVKEEPAQTIKGTEYNMSFDHATMSNIIKSIEAKFNVEVVLSDAGINNCLLSADFTDQSLGRTLKLISDAMDYSYEIKGNTVTLTGSGCP